MRETDASKASDKVNHHSCHRPIQKLPKKLSCSINLLHQITLRMKKNFLECWMELRLRKHLLQKSSELHADGLFYRPSDLQFIGKAL